MNHYVFDTARSYGAYLRAGASGALPRTELSAHWSRLIGLSAEEAASSSRFHWGVSEQLLAVGHFSQPLADLKQSAKTAAETWAAEQLELARDAYRRGLDGEALGYLQRGMDGGNGQHGYALEYRAHFLQGLIRLGSFQHSDPAVLDLAKAEAAFLAAARYAPREHRAEGARAMLAAGWAAYAQGQMARAIAHTEQAITLQSGFADAYFQVSKILFHTRQPDLAAAHLVTAVELNPTFAVQAAVDGDFARFAQEAAAVVESRRHQIGQAASRALQDVMRRGKESGILATDGSAARTTGEAIEEFSAVASAVASATQAMRTNSLYGYMAAEKLVAQAGVVFEVAMRRGEQARRLAEDTLETAEQLSAQLSLVEIGSYRLSETAEEEFNKATGLIAQGRAALGARGLPAVLDAEQYARRAVLALNGAVEAYKTASLAQAEAERTALLEELEQPSAPKREASSTIRSCAIIGALIAVIPGGYFNLFLHGMPAAEQWPLAMMRLVITVAVGAGAGGVFGYFVSQNPSGDSAGAAPALDARRTALDATIARLRDFSVDHLRASH